MANLRRTLQTSLIIFSSFSASSCFWGDTNESPETTGKTSDTVTTKIVPALGTVTNAVIEVFQADHRYFNPRVGGSTGASGFYTITRDDEQAYPLKIEVRPQSTTQYYDESSERFVDNSGGDIPTLMAWVPEYRSSVAVTPLTTLAAHLLEDIIDVTATDVENANETIAEAFGLGEFDILVEPPAINAPEDVALLNSTNSHVHAALLVALAETGAGLERPMAEIASDLIADSDDGILDGQSDSGAIISSYSNSDDFPATFAEEFLSIKDHRFASTFSFDLQGTDKDLLTRFEAKQDADADDGRSPIGSGESAQQCFNNDMYVSGNQIYLKYKVTTSDNIQYEYEYEYDINSTTTGYQREGFIRVGGADFYSDDFVERYSLDTVNNIATFESYVTTNTSSTTRADIDSLYAPGYSLDYSLAAGAAIDESYTNNTYNSVSNQDIATHYDREWLYRGDESVTVPAASNGTFTACRFQETLTDTDNDTSSENTFWYAVESGVMIKAKIGDLTYQLQQGKINSSLVTPQ